MAIAYTSSTNFTAGNATITGISKPASTAIGDVLVAQGYFEQNGGVSAVLASTGDTWTEIHNISNLTPNPDMNCYVWYTVVANASSTMSVTGDAGVAFRDFTVARFTGVDTTTPIDVTATENSGSSTTVTATGVASGTANRWLVMCTFNFNGDTSASWTSPLTERNDSENVAMAAGADTAGTDTANKTATISPTVDWAAIMFALREAGAAAPTKAPPRRGRPIRYFNRRVIR